MDPVPSDTIEITAEEIASQKDTPEHKKVWYQQSYWSEKGVPIEKLSLAVGENQITVCNFNREIPFADNFSQRAQVVLSDVAARFPYALHDMKWIVIDDRQALSLYNDEGKYPQNGRTLQGTPEGTMILEPRAFVDTPHRVSAAPNFEGALVHELGHQLYHEFDPEWREKFPWMYVGDDPENWTFDKSGEKDISKLKPPVNKTTGDIAIDGRYPAHPKECVTNYARINEHEDICESLVAYLYDPNLLKGVSEDKFNVIAQHDQTRIMDVM